MRAGYGFVGAPSTGMPADQSIAATMSESKPPHLPRTRTGRIQPFHPRPDTPSALLLRAAMIPETRVPCQELSLAWQPLSGSDEASLLVTQSPGSEASRSQLSPSFAIFRSVMKSYPGNSRPPAPASARSGCSRRTPVSSTAITTPVLPVEISQALTASTALGVVTAFCRYHCPGNSVSSGIACACRRRSSSAYWTFGSARSASSAGSMDPGAARTPRSSTRSLGSILRVCRSANLVRPAIEATSGSSVAAPAPCTLAVPRSFTMTRTWPSSPRSRDDIAGGTDSVADALAHAAETSSSAAIREVVFMCLGSLGAGALGSAFPPGRP